MISLTEFHYTAHWDDDDVTQHTSSNTRSDKQCELLFTDHVCIR